MPTPKPRWTQQQAIEFCTLLETIAPAYGCHVALTGGCLYKDGERKDCDVLFYRIRQIEAVDVDGLLVALASLGITLLGDYGWCCKLIYQGRAVDFFFPERPGCEPNYPPEPSIQLADVEAF